MSSLVQITIRVSLVLGLSFSNGNIARGSMTYAFDDSCLPDYHLGNTSSSIFSSKANNTTEDEPYDPGDVGKPKNGDGAGSR